MWQTCPALILPIGAWYSTTAHTGHTHTQKECGSAALPPWQFDILPALLGFLASLSSLVFCCIWHFKLPFYLFHSLPSFFFFLLLSTFSVVVGLPEMENHSSAKRFMVLLQRAVWIVKALALIWLPGCPRCWSRLQSSERVWRSGP